MLPARARLRACIWFELAEALFFPQALGFRVQRVWGCCSHLATMKQACIDSASHTREKRADFQRNRVL